MNTRSFLCALVLAGKKCLVLGSTAEASVRAKRLLEAGADVTVVAEAPAPELELMASTDEIRLERRAFQSADLDGVWLVVLADQDTPFAAALARECTARRIFHCSVDQPRDSGFHHVALARAGLVSVGVSTDGAAPALAKRLRAELERVLSASGLARFAEELAKLRAATASADRKRAFDAALRGLRFTGKLELPSDDNA